MNSRKVAQEAAKWSAMAMADIGQRIRGLIRQEGLSVEGFASKYGIPVSQMAFILKTPSAPNVTEPSISTLVKLIVMSDLAIEIKPVSETPIGSYDLSDADTFEPRFPNHFQHRPSAARPAQPAQRPSVPKTERCQNGWNEFEEFDDEELLDEEPLDEEPYEFTMEEPQGEENPRFENMSRQELVRIIEEHLWTSEIDVQGATRDELVDFLYKKDEMYKKLKNKDRNENSAKRLEELQEGLRNAVRRNPGLAKHLAPFLK